MPGGATLLALAASISARLLAADAVVVAGPHIRLADIAQLSGGDAAERRQVGARVIAVMPRGRRSFTLSRAALADRALRAANVRVSTQGEGAIRLSLRAPMAATSGPCWAAVQAIPAGRAIRPDMLQAAACEAGQSQALLPYHSGDRAVRSAVDIPAGAPVGRLVASSAPVVATGDQLTLVSQSGPVRLRRPVTALQPGHEGRAMFVRDEDGTVMAVPVRGASAE